MLQLYDKQLGWDFHHELRTKYGPMSKLQFLFGVSDFPSVYVCFFVCDDSDYHPIETTLIRLRSGGHANYRFEGAPAP